MPHEQKMPTSMYCRKCGYQLHGLSENRCPECGRTFDPANRRTYLQHPKGSSRRWWLRVAGVTLLVLLALIAAGMYGTHAWLRWRGWRVQVRPRDVPSPWRPSRCVPGQLVHH
jgi:ribosomal protein L37E